MALIEVNRDNTQEVVSAMETAIMTALEEVGLVAERFAKEATPVDTGRLRNSITHAVDADEKAVYIGTNVEYARYVELGVRGREGVHMLHDAAANHVDVYSEIFEKHMRGK